MLRGEPINLLAIVLVVLFTIRLTLAVLYRPGRQVEYRIGRGSGTGEALGVSWLRLRVRSLNSGNEYTVPLTRIRRR